MSITPRVTRRLYERMQLAPDVKRRTSVPKFDGATPGPDPSGAQPPKYPPSLPSLAPRPLPPLARHHFYPILPSHEFASRISANFPRPNPDNRRGSRRVSNHGIFILEYRRYLYNGRGYNRCVFETRNLAYIYIYLSLSLQPIRLLCKCPETRAKEEPVERRLQRNCYNVKVVTRTLGFFSSSPSSSFSFPLFVFSLFIFRRGARENFHEGRRRFPES